MNQEPDKKDTLSFDDVQVGDTIWHFDSWRVKKLAVESRSQNQIKARSQSYLETITRTRFSGYRRTEVEAYKDWVDANLERLELAQTAHDKAVDLWKEAKARGESE